MDNETKEAVRRVLRESGDARQLGDAELKRDSLQKAMTRSARSANDDMDEFVHNVRQAITEAKNSLLEAISPASLNRFVEDWVGPIRVDSNGLLHPVGLETTQAPDESGACVTSNIAGGRYARCPHNLLSVRQFAAMSARAVFWAHLRAVA